MPGNVGEAVRERTGRQQPFIYSGSFAGGGEIGLG